MDKQQFNNMEVLEQLEYINNNIGTESLTKYCDTLGINRSTITKRFKNIGYTFNKELNKYVLNDTTEVQQNNSGETTRVQQSNNRYVTIDQYKALENRIKALEEAYKKLNTTEVQQNNNGNATEVQQNSNSDTIRFYKNEVVVRAYRIDEEVYRRFKAYTDDNKQYKISDIISTAMEDFLNKYSK